MDTQAQNPIAKPALELLFRCSAERQGAEQDLSEVRF